MKRKLGEDDGTLVRTDTQYLLIGLTSLILSIPAFFYSIELSAILFLEGLAFQHRSYQHDKLDEVYQSL